MNFNLQPQQQQYETIAASSLAANQTSYTAPICTENVYQQQQEHQTLAAAQQPYHQAAPTSWVPPDPFSDAPMIVTSFDETQSQKSPIQPKEQILEEIVRECEEIERRSSSGGSPASSIWSSDERESNSSPELPSYHPYKTPERKERKKAQNRLAATRYREKKRKEKEEAMECIEGLSSRNGELKSEVSELEKEIKYLKKLMTELGIALDQLPTTSS
ncbi:unnamed protein product [Caenorhabditis angaria]|uniref:BZIP domain-containing protein n=1 Tax=Caenorhabditis angaria TaxID=860376 RepID=A0A9P1J0W8_9PELO|nr:unnamed protein product [Caenorhabditis angaria]